MKNIFKINVPEAGELFETLLQHKNIRIERIVSSDKILPKEYCQEEDEWVLLVEGSATLEVEGKVHELKKGDFLFIPSGQRHKVLKTQKGTIWLGVFVK